MSELTQEAIQQIAAMATPVVVTSALPGGLPSVLVPDGYELTELTSNERLAPRPRRIAGTVKVSDVASFVEYFGDFSDANSRIFGDDAAASVLAVLDYHQDGKPADGEIDGTSEADKAGPRWCEHRLQLTLRKSEEWVLWLASNTKRMSQEDFARFLEDNAPDLLVPDSASMLEIARSMTAKLEINVDSAVRTNKGATFRYNEVVKAGGLGAAGEFSVPDEFTIKIPVYVGDAPVAIRARLRYQIGSGKLAMWYDLWRCASVERSAFKAIRESIQSGTATTVLSGQPA